MNYDTVNNVKCVMKLCHISVSTTVSLAVSSNCVMKREKKMFFFTPAQFISLKLNGGLSIILIYDFLKVWLDCVINSSKCVMKVWLDCVINSSNCVIQVCHSECVMVMTRSQNGGTWQRSNRCAQGQKSRYMRIFSLQSSIG